MIQLDYRDARPIYNQVYDGYREQIAAGVLQAGEKLPSVRELATELTINPNTIQRAYRQLEQDGWIASVPGKGSFVCGKAEAPSSLWHQLDEAVDRLYRAGASEEEIRERIRRGHHA